MLCDVWSMYIFVHRGNKKPVGSAVVVAAPPPATYLLAFSAQEFTFSQIMAVCIVQFKQSWNENSKTREMSGSRCENADMYAVM